MKQLLLSVLAFLAIISGANAQTCTPLGDQTSYGTNDTWIGYVYSNPDFTGYVGYVNQGSPGNPFFDQNFGGADTTYATNGCSIQTETFSVRYKLTRVVPNGTYRVTIAGDDGYRFSVDGGAHWIVNKWQDQTYITTTIDITLSGTVNAVIEYYENTGPNRLTFAFGAVCVPMENQGTYGSNNIWKGYVYNGTSFNTYKGMVNEGTTANFGFDESFGGDAVTYNTTACGVTTDNFSVRYRLAKTFVAGTYTFIVGGDAGYRFSLNGGSTWVVNNWAAHSYTTTSYNVTLSGAYNMVLEYYDNTGSNRVTISMIQNTVLPIKLISFAGKQASSGLQLAWNVSDDSDPGYFDVQKSTDGVSFNSIGRVQGSKATTYAFTDASQASGTAAYRLKMTDRTGAVIYSHLISFRTSGETSQGINIYPTLVTGNSVSFETAGALRNASLVISDANGRQLSRRVLGKLRRGQVSSIETSSSKLPSGVYFLQVIDGNENIGVQRFVVK